MDPAGNQELIVPISPYPDGSPVWEDTVADTLRVIADLRDPATTRRLAGSSTPIATRSTRWDDRDAWNTVELRLAGRDAS